MSEDKPITPEIVTDDDEKKSQLVQRNVKPEYLYLVPITGRPHLPAQVQPLIVNQSSWEETLKKSTETSNNLLGLSYIREITGDDITESDFPDVGCVIKIMNVVEFEGKLQFIAQGLERFRIKRFLSNKSPFLVQVEYFEKIKENEEQVKAYAISIINSIKQLLSLNPLYSEELKQYLGRFSPDDPSPLTDFAAGITTASGDDLQEVLETVSITQRMNKVLVLLRKEIEIARLQTKIQKDVDTKIDDNKRKFFLKEQLKAIQQELGISKDDKTSDVDQFKERFAKLKPPKHVVKRFEDEVQKLSILETGSSEYGVTRNYLDWISAFPWGIHSEDNIDIEKAEKILDRDHSGLSDVKDRIIEFFAAGIYKKKYLRLHPFIRRPSGSW